MRPATAPRGPRCRFTERILEVEALENDPKKRKFREVLLECDPNP